MFVIIFFDKIKFYYKFKNWYYYFDEIKEFGLIKREKKYFLENGVFIVVIVVVYYCMIFFNLMDLYYIILIFLCYIFIIIVRFNDFLEFVYFVFVKDIY